MRGKHVGDFRQAEKTMGWGVENVGHSCSGRALPWSESVEVERVGRI
jgi:hypothetical protein